MPSSRAARGAAIRRRVPARIAALSRYAWCAKRIPREGAMPDSQARQTFETLLSNILEHVRTVPMDHQETVLAETRHTLQSIASRHGLSEAQAADWAKEIDQELRFRLMYDPHATSNDNG
jgi:AraC-like DNA-binding protein